MPNCRNCGAEIQFIKTKNGKNMPFDTDLVNSDYCEDGIFLADEELKIFKVSDKTRGRFGFNSHFDTCEKSTKKLMNELKDLNKGNYVNNSR